MPRRRAVRVIGVTLATMAVPGVRPRRAGAQPGQCTKTTCGADQRCCQKVAGGILETYCCPRPSWQFQCDGQSNGYRCVNVCRGKTEFPCTALIAHPESGVNGVCCDRRYHIGCARVGPEPDKRPDGSVVDLRWKPSCCPKGFGFCGGICCEPPNRCKHGRCTCPDGSASLDGRRCCKRGQHAAQCISEDTKAVSFEGSFISGSVVGRKCCPSAKPYCCGSTCCKEFGCCGDTCCPHATSRCAMSRGKKVCCPTVRLGVMNDHFVCCPPGTGLVPTTGGCCPFDSLDCCGDRKGSGIDCGAGKLCVKGTCVTP